MKEIEFANTTLFASDKLCIFEKVDREDHLYYPNDEIIFSIICINNSKNIIENILIKDILPKEVVPNLDGKYLVNVSKGFASQKGNVIELKVDKLGANEAIRLVIKGRVSG